MCAYFKTEGAASSVCLIKLKRSKNNENNGPFFREKIWSMLSAPRYSEANVLGARRMCPEP